MALVVGGGRKTEILKLWGSEGRLLKNRRGIQNCGLRLLAGECVDWQKRIPEAGGSRRR
jgi:hypothetical protein